MLLPNSPKAPVTIKITKTRTRTAKISIIIVEIDNPVDPLLDIFNFINKLYIDQVPRQEGRV